MSASAKELNHLYDELWQARLERDKLHATVEELQKELAKAREENERLTRECDALDAKVQSLAPHGTCGCSYDRPDDVCDHHSPQLAKAREERDYWKASADAGDEYTETLRAVIAKAREALAAISHLANTGSNYHACTRIGQIARAALQPEDRTKPVDAVARARIQSEASLKTLDRALKQRIERKAALPPKEPK